MKSIHTFLVTAFAIIQFTSAFVVPGAQRTTPSLHAPFQRADGRPIIRSASHCNLLPDASLLLLAETEPWVQPSALILDPFLNLMSFAMLARVVLSWYPEQRVNQFPWAIVVFPTEPLLRAVKGFVPPAFGVDITPVFWLAIFTFVHEILLGQQGLLTMKIKYGI